MKRMEKSAGNRLRKKVGEKGVAQVTEKSGEEAKTPSPCCCNANSGRTGYDFFIAIFSIFKLFSSDKD